MNAIVLAGAPNHGPLRDISPASNEAFVEIKGKPLLSYVYHALLDVPELKRIIIVGPVDEMTSYLRPEPDRIYLIEAIGSMLENLRAGMSVVPQDEKVMVVTADIPLVGAKAISDLVRRCEEVEADFYYSIIRKDDLEAKFGQSKRTYVRIREGTFTGGNIVVVNPRVVEQALTRVEDFVRYRKKPLKLAAILGWSFIIKFFLGMLTIPAIEKRLSDLFNVTARAVITPYPEIGIDVDKPEDVEFVSKYL